MATVLKQFPWSNNGYDVEILNVGDEREFGAATAGLVAEGFVSGEAKVETPAEPVVEDPVEAVAETTADEPLVEPAAPAVAEQPKRRRKG